MLARSKLNSIETLTSKALLDYEVSHEEYQTIINEEEKYRKTKEDIGMVKIQKINELNEEYVNDIQYKSGVQNMCDLKIKTIKGICDAETLTKEQIRKYKRYGLTI